jgi:tetratricopeptide (TPR) repeat protein
MNEKLAADFPAAPDHRSRLAGNHNGLGALLARLGRTAAAEAEFRAALIVGERLAVEVPAVPDYRAGVAYSHNGLGALLTRLGQHVAAEAEYRSALTVRQKLATDFPEVPDYRRDLAVSRTNLGTVYLRLGRRSAAEAEYRAAVTVREKVASDFPAVPEYAVELCGNYLALGVCLGEGGDAEGFLTWHAKAIDRLTAVVAVEPRSARARQTLLAAHLSRAAALERLRRYADALPDWDAALKFADGPARLGPRARRASCLGRAAEAAREAVELAADPAATAGTVYDCACALALASAAPDSPAADALAARGVELLRQTLAKGFNNVPHLLADPDLAPLRRRADFAELLWDLADAPPGR